MSAILNLIKPKRLSESNKAYIYNDKVILNFGAVDVVAYEGIGVRTKDCVCIDHKSLYNNDFDNATNDIYDINLPESLKYFEVEINARDNSFFSSISGAGEDLFWTGLLDIDNHKNFKSFVYGLNFAVEYGNIIIDRDKDPFIYFADYNIFYYLFQMTKHLSGKKTDTVLVSEFYDKRKYCITNKDRDFYVFCDVANTALFYKCMTIPEIKEAYIINKKLSSTELFKKTALESNGALFKNFSRAFGDVLNCIDDKYVKMFYDDRLILYLMKDKYE